MLVDTGTLTEIPWKSATGGCNGLSAYHISFRDFVHQRSDAMLSTVSEWCTSGSPNGLSVFQLGRDTLAIKYQHTTEGHQLPGDDGRVYTANGGLFDRNLSAKGRIAGQQLFPGIGGILYLGMDGKGDFTVYQCGATTPLVRWGAFPDWGAEEQRRNDQRLSAWTTNSFSFDKQIVFDPLHGRIVMIPNALDRIVQRPFDAKRVLEAAGIDYLVVCSRPPMSAPLGKPWIYQVRTLSKAGGVSCSLESGPDGMTVASDGKVSWTPKGAVGTCEGVILLVKDKSGEQRFHSFDVWVAGPER
jgi:hypothetical protein